MIRDFNIVTNRESRYPRYLQLRKLAIPHLVPHYYSDKEPPLNQTRLCMQISLAPIPHDDCTVAEPQIRTDEGPVLYPISLGAEIMMKPRNGLPTTR